MNNPFFEKPILNSPYERPELHWELDENGQPTQKIVESRRQVSFITAVPTSKKQRGSSLNQASLVFDRAAREYETDSQQYDLMQTINGVRRQVDRWREIPDQNQWRVTPETARLLRHWRHHQFSGIRPFFCQVEAVETAIWLTEVAPNIGQVGRDFLNHLENANKDANPELSQLALKLATGGRTRY